MTQFGLFLPNLGPFADACVLADLARSAEDASWDGFFIWDHILFDADSALDVVDPWVALGAIAAMTHRIRLGALMTPLSRRRPWKVARETVSVDRLSQGRLVFGAGLGFPPDAEFDLFGEVSADRVRAERLDEALQVLEGLWSTDRYEHHGPHFDLGPVTFTPRPVQSPRIPVWVAGWWPHKAPYRRAARWDGVFPELVGGALPSVDDVRDLVAYISSHRADDRPFDVVLSGADVATRDDIAAYEEAGVTWWLERFTPDRAFSVADAQRLIDRGPPR